MKTITKFLKVTLVVRDWRVEAQALRYWLGIQTLLQKFMQSGWVAQETVNCFS